MVKIPPKAETTVRVTKKDGRYSQAKAGMLVRAFALLKDEGFLTAHKANAFKRFVGSKVGKRDI